MAKKRRKTKKAAATSGKRKAAKRSTKKKTKRKPTAKQLRAWRKNIKKARAALGQKTKRKKRSTKKRKTAKRKKPRTAAQKAAATRAKYARQSKAYMPMLSPGIAAQQIKHRAQAKREDRAMRAMYKSRGKTKKAPALTLSQKADLALALLNSRAVKPKYRVMATSTPIIRTLPARKQRPFLKGIVKAGSRVRLYRDFFPGQQKLKFGNPRRKRRNPSLYANPRRRKHARTRRNPIAVQWWIADLYVGNKKQTFIDAACRGDAEYSARRLASKHPGARVELSGPYATQPTASTARR